MGEPSKPCFGSKPQNHVSGDPFPKRGITEEISSPPPLPHPSVVGKRDWKVIRVIDRSQIAAKSASNLVTCTWSTAPKIKRQRQTNSPSPVEGGTIGPNAQR